MFKTTNYNQQILSEIIKSHDVSLTTGDLKVKAVSQNSDFLPLLKGETTTLPLDSVNFSMFTRKNLGDLKSFVAYYMKLNKIEPNNSFLKEAEFCTISFAIPFTGKIKTKYSSPTVEFLPCYDNPTEKSAQVLALGVYYNKQPKKIRVCSNLMNVPARSSMAFSFDAQPCKFVHITNDFNYNSSSENKFDYSVSTFILREGKDFQYYNSHDKSFTTLMRATHMDWNKLCTLFENIPNLSILNEEQLEKIEVLANYKHELTSFTSAQQLFGVNFVCEDNRYLVIFIPFDTETINLQSENDISLESNERRIQKSSIRVYSVNPIIINNLHEKINKNFSALGIMRFMRKAIDVASYEYYKQHAVWSYDKICARLEVFLHDSSALSLGKHDLRRAKPKDLLNKFLFLPKPPRHLHILVRDSETQQYRYYYQSPQAEKPVEVENVSQQLLEKLYKSNSFNRSILFSDITVKLMTIARKNIKEMVKELNLIPSIPVLEHALLCLAGFPNEDVHISRLCAWKRTSKLLDFNPYPNNSRVKTVKSIGIDVIFDKGFFTEEGKKKFVEYFENHAFSKDEFHAYTETESRSFNYAVENECYRFYFSFAYIDRLWPELKTTISQMLSNEQTYRFYKQYSQTSSNTLEIEHEKNIIQQQSSVAFFKPLLSKKITQSIFSMDTQPSNIIQNNTNCDNNVIAFKKLLYAMQNKQASLRTILFYKGHLGHKISAYHKMPNCLPDSACSVFYEYSTYNFIYRIDHDGTLVDIPIPSGLMTYLFDYLMYIRLSDDHRAHNHEGKECGGTLGGSAYYISSVFLKNVSSPTALFEHPQFLKQFPNHTKEHHLDKNIKNLFAGYFIPTEGLEKNDIISPVHSIGDKTYSLIEFFNFMCDHFPELYWAGTGKFNYKEIATVDKNSQEFIGISEKIMERQKIIEEKFKSENIIVPSQKDDNNQGDRSCSPRFN